MNIGERVGDYEIVQILGAGGMGQVYKVRNVFSDRIEAMKVLLPNLGGDRELAERFQREIKVQAALDHPNIARLNTAQLVGNQLIMVMEFVEGNSVEFLLRQGPLPLQTALGCMVQVLDALSYAHAHGVVHRDIKPGNIMLTSQGTAKLMDFGIARIEADRKLTQTGHAVGSLFYMSPEQIKGLPLDARSDIYSLGITMYEMVTGRRPFDGTSDFSIMSAHLEQKPVAPMEVIPGVPSELSEIILMAIAKDPAQRFQSAHAFQGALKNLNIGQGVRPAATAIPPTVINAPVMQAPPPMPMASAVGQSPMAPPPMPGPAPVAPQFQAPPPYGAQPFPAAPAQRSSNRGLYMAMGSIATILVIAAAVIEGPKLWHSGASVVETTNQPQVTNPPAEPSSNNPSQTGQPGQPSQTQPAQTDPSQSNPVQSNPSQSNPVQSNPVQTNPVQSNPVTTRPVQNEPTQKPPTKPVQVKQSNPVSKPPVQQPPTQINAQQPPVQQPVQQQPVQQQPVQQQPAVTTQQPSGPSPQQAAQMNELRQEYNSLAIRVSAAKSGLRSIQSQMQRQGLDLRGDIVEAESRMDYQMKEAQDSMRANDAAGAKNDMRMAEYAVQQIEKFLGR